MNVTRVAIAPSAIVVGVPPLLCLLAMLGSDRVMFSVDYPYATNREGTDVILGAPISEADRGEGHR